MNEDRVNKLNLMEAEFSKNGTFLTKAVNLQIQGPQHNDISVLASKCEPRRIKR